MTVVITHFPSPYQVELFNEIERQHPGWLKVIYLFRRDPTRSWKGVAATHAHTYLDESGVHAVGNDRTSNRQSSWCSTSSTTAAPRQLIRVRERTGKPWCFWGERPGYRYAWLARLNRLGRLAALRGGQQPIWGIGNWAVDAYRKEFGSSRTYLNLPYYSNIDRFQRSRPVYSKESFHVPVFRRGDASQRC